MDTHKDRQERAIIIFTIVTIVFLPLSFVSSVFGMNTHDIRDMPYGQWAYWAAGVPLTVVVVIGSLWWAGELGSIGRWIGRALPLSKSSRRSATNEPGLVDMLRTTRTEKKEYDLEQLPPRPRRRTTYPRGEAQ
jgi:hypothetical protein